jgi:hypothetical protein
MKLPIIKPISFISDAINSLDIPINKAQVKNLALIMTVMILSGSLCLSKIISVALGPCAVNTLSHCFNYAGLDGHLLMKSALRYAIKVLSLHTIRIKIAIDDTMKHHSKFCTTIHGVYWLFDHVIGASCKAKCIAYLIVNETIRFPIGWRVFEQKEKQKGQTKPCKGNSKDINGVKKWELALELINEAIDLGFSIEAVLFDSWYCVHGMVRALDNLKIKWISEVKSSHIAEFWVQEDKLLRKIALSIADFFKVGECICKIVELGLKFPDQDVQKTLYKTYEKVIHIRAFNGAYKLVRSVDQRSGASKIFITNELTWEAQKILTVYSSRWLIEEFFKNAKGLYGLEKACIRSKQGGAISFFLVSFVDLLISIQLWKSVHDNPGKGQPTVSAIIAFGQEENLRNLIPLLEDPSQRQVIIDALLQQLQSEQSKKRKPRKELVPIGTSPPSSAPDPSSQKIFTEKDESVNGTAA